MKNLDYNKQTFEEIRHFDENGNEFWYARELQNVLNYKDWRKFDNVINKAIVACSNSKIGINEHFGGVDKMIEISVSDHFVGVDKMVEIGSGAMKNILDYIDLMGFPRMCEVLNVVQLEYAQGKIDKERIAVLRRDKEYSKGGKK